MTTGQAVVYGIVQGLTEYLPISSTAHLRIVPALLGWKDPGAAFTAVIQIGTLLAVLAYFYHDIVRIVSATCRGLIHGKPFETTDARMGWMIAGGTLPLLAFGFLFKDNIETNLRSLYVISAALIGLALVLMAAEGLVQWRLRTGHRPRELENLNWRDAILVGLAQAIALIPGSSRSGVTITAGLFLGMSRETAARFSFLLSLPSILLAGLYELVGHWSDLLHSNSQTINLIVATAVSGIVGYLSIAFLLRYLKTHTTWCFIGYRLVVGGALLVLLATGRLQP